MGKKEQRNINFWKTFFTNVFCFLNQIIYLIWKALTEIIVTKSIFHSSFLPTDFIILPALPGLYSSFYVYILNYLADGCNKWNLTLGKMLFFIPFSNLQ